MNIRACERARPSQRVTHPSASSARKVADRAAAGECGRVPPVQLDSPQTDIGAYQSYLHARTSVRRTRRQCAAPGRVSSIRTGDSRSAAFARPEVRARACSRARTHARRGEFGYPGTPDVIFFPVAFSGRYLNDGTGANAYRRLTSNSYLFS